MAAPWEGTAGCFVPPALLTAGRALGWETLGVRPKHTQWHSLLLSFPERVPSAVLNSVCWGGAMLHNPALGTGLYGHSHPALCLEEHGMKQGERGEVSTELSSGRVAFLGRSTLPKQQAAPASLDMPTLESGTAASCILWALMREMPRTLCAFGANCVDASSSELHP